jgi:hypothetical protein
MRQIEIRKIRKIRKPKQSTTTEPPDLRIPSGRLLPF